MIVEGGPEKSLAAHSLSCPFLMPWTRLPLNFDTLWTSNTAEWKHSCCLSFVKSEHYVVISDQQSHRAVWSRGGGHVDQTRQEDYRWVCCCCCRCREQVQTVVAVVFWVTPEGKFSSTQHHESRPISAHLCLSRHRRAVCPEEDRRQRHRHLRHGGGPLQVRQPHLPFRPLVRLPPWKKCDCWRFSSVCRASRSLSQGAASAQHEKMLCETWCKEVRTSVDGWLPNHPTTAFRLSSLITIYFSQKLMGNWLLVKRCSWRRNELL